jgi:hypothetical protein
MNNGADLRSHGRSRRDGRFGLPFSHGRAAQDHAMTRCNRSAIVIRSGAVVSLDESAGLQQSFVFVDGDSDAGQSNLRSGALWLTSDTRDLRICSGKQQLGFGILKYDCCVSAVRVRRQRALPKAALHLRESLGEANDE